MGELIEYTTVPRHGRRFYKFSSQCLVFSVRAPENVYIGLASCPGYSSIHHWIFIDDYDQNTGVKEFDEDIVTVNTPNILNNNEYKKFLLTWYGKKIELSRFGETTPIFSIECSIEKEVQFVTFSELNHDVSIDWKFLLPPQVERPTLKPIIGGKPYWVQYDGILPYGALLGGYENEFLYIMRAPHEGSLTPGKFVPSMRCGFVAWGSESHVKTDFEILCMHDCLWVPTANNVIPSGAFPAGYTEYAGAEVMYIGRAVRDGHLIPGKVAPSHSVCYFAYGNDTVYENNYEILVAPYSSPRCTNSIVTPVVNCETYQEYDDS
ncbi:unnamed protein product [Leptosia nina]|uniref:Farnesoic acid O-methyl transferase domain-containing protein n=1 Tax=Leptosia nina TaxID=320188 RepID=A0AAV1J7T1_9NEOP